MKKILSLVAFFAILVPSFAMAKVKYLQITVKEAKLWPVKSDGRCWDPCLGKRFQLPARGAKEYNKYFENPEFAKACQYSLAPDALVEIKVGKYEVFTTDKMNNSCTPKWNVSKVFRVVDGASFSVGVYDNDGAAGFQAKRDLMGLYTSASLPAELVNGGTFVLKSFGQVEELVLEAKIVEKPASAGCDGVYKVRIVEFDVHATKENGKTWDRGFGRLVKPDVEVFLKIGTNKLDVPKHQDTLQAKLNNVSTTISIKKGDSLSLKVADRDRSFTGKLEYETIGETAVSDVCSIIKENGTHTFADFGRVKKVVVIFEKK